MAPSLSPSAGSHCGLSSALRSMSIHARAGEMRMSCLMCPPAVLLWADQVGPVGSELPRETGGQRRLHCPLRKAQQHGAAGSGRVQPAVWAGTASHSCILMPRRRAPTRRRQCCSPSILDPECARFITLLQQPCSASAARATPVLCPVQRATPSHSAASSDLSLIQLAVLAAFRDAGPPPVQDMTTLCASIQLSSTAPAPSPPTTSRWSCPVGSLVAA